MIVFKTHVMDVWMGVKSTGPLACLSQFFVSLLVKDLFLWSGILLTPNLGLKII